MSVSQTSELPSSEIVAVTRQQLWQAGYHCLAVLTQDKRPLGNDWGERARRSPPEVLNFPPVAHALNTGVLSDDLRPIDIDIDIPAIAEAALDLILDTLGDAPVRRRGNSPRCLAVYRAAEGPQRKIVLAGRHGKIEVLGRGQQFVAAGTHPSGAELSWSPELRYTPAADLPAVTEDQIFDLLTALAPLIDAPPPARANGHDHTPHEGEPSEPQADILRVTAALAAIPNSGPADWESWNRVGMATWAATGGSQAGWRAWDAWSARNPAYDQLEAIRRWEHYPTSPPTRIGAGSLFHMAGDSFRPPQPTPFGLDAAREIDAQGGQETEGDKRDIPGNVPPRAAILSLAQLDGLKDPAWLVDRLIPEQSMAVFYGPPKSGKSFILMSLGLHIAAKREWFGRPVGHGAVIYIAGEGVGGLKHRVKAMLTEYGISQDIPFWVVPRAVNFRLEIDVAALVELVRVTVAASPHTGTPVVLVVVDTLARAMPGADENSAQDVGLVIAQCDAVKDELACAVALVHHEGKDETRGARGTSALRGAWDAAARITGTGKTTKLEVIEQKDAESGAVMRFEMREVVTGIGRSSLVPILSEAQSQGDGSQDGDGASQHDTPFGRAAGPRLAGKASILLRILERISRNSESAGKGVDQMSLRREFYETQVGSEQEAKKKAFRRALEILLEKQMVEVNDPWIRLVGKSS